MIYVAFLRGINVAGHTVTMERLRGLFTELGLANVRSYIQTGNVFFESDMVDEAALTRRIEQHLQSVLGYTVPVCLRTVDELEHTVALDPFRKLEVRPDMRLCVVFVPEPVRQDLPLPMKSPKGDMEIIGVTKREAFVVWYLINGRPPSSDKLLTEVLGPGVTTRFFHTTQKILAAAKQG